MAKLTEYQLEEAREHLRNWDLHNFEFWMRKNKIVVDYNMVMDTFRKIEKTGDTEKALRIFNAVFPYLDPKVDRFIKIGIWILCLISLFTIFVAFQ
jgi:hypothetical protein